MITQHFDPRNAENFFKIPHPGTVKLDQLIWASDKQDMYSVKSGYQIALSFELQDQPSNSRASLTEWNAIWKLEIPEKIMVFMWRAAQDLLPTVGNLWKKKA